MNGSAFTRHTCRLLAGLLILLSARYAGADSVQDDIDQWRVMVQEGRAGQARAAARQALQERGSIVAILRFLADMEIDPEELDRLLAEMYAASPPEQHTGLLAERAMTAYLEERYQDAAAHAQAMLTAGGEERRGLFILAASYRRLGDEEQAILTFQRVVSSLKVDALSGAAAVNLAELFFERGDKTGAAQYARIAAANGAAIDPTLLVRIGTDDKNPAPPENDAATHRAAPPATTGDLFYVQVGAFSQQANAEQLHGRLRNAGYPVIVSMHDGGGNTVYRVRIGPFTRRAQAKRIVDELDASQNLFSYVIKVDAGQDTE
ncbi:SPOR domain-containing protein [bacterium]|nr:SPOR domain-containing protein [candidate division CSSED10-310 bacterium]